MNPLTKSNERKAKREEKKKRGGLADNINKIIDGCPSCKKRRDSKTLDR
jgi:hypothetical protein